MYDTQSFYEGIGVGKEDQSSGYKIGSDALADIRKHIFRLRAFDSDIFLCIIFELSQKF